MSYTLKYICYRTGDVIHEKTPWPTRAEAETRKIYLLVWHKAATGTVEIIEGAER